MDLVNRSANILQLPGTLNNSMSISASKDSNFIVRELLLLDKCLFRFVYIIESESVNTVVGSSEFIM